MPGIMINVAEHTFKQEPTAISPSNVHSGVFIYDNEACLHHPVPGPIPNISQSPECMSVIFTLLHLSRPWTGPSGQNKARLWMVVPGPEVST